MRVMILAAGRGERMRPLTDHTPKPLLAVGGKPLIVWHIERMVSAGITDLVINHAHLGTQIEQTLGDGKQFGASIQYSDEGDALETAGGIAFALPLLGDEPFAVVNGDVYCDYDFTRLTALAKQLQRSEDNIHLLLVDNPIQHLKGDFALLNERVIPESRMPSPDYPLLTFSGIGIYKPAVFADIVCGKAAPLAPLLRKQIAKDKARGERHQGIWFDIGTPQRLNDLDKMLYASQNASYE